ncbi:MAG TPA: AI-2E family transporter [Candidatus Limnocylindrales bacterium]|nr:AI-2E family transporter [Candidatus Limnocylindrales bacterium]
MTFSRDPAARTRARARWTALGERLRTISPESAAKGVIAALVVGTCFALSVGTWPSLAPFVAGIVIAYAVLPIANRLDRFMPRVLAALIAELVAVATIVGVLLLVVPPILRGLLQVATRLPTGARLQAELAAMQAQLGELPEPLRSIVLAVATESAANIQATINGVVETAGQVVSSQILGVFNTLSVVLGLLVIPAWILTIVADERAIKQRAGALLPAAIRPDAAAIVGIMDRAFGTFLRVRVVLAIVSGFLVFLGLELTNAAGLTDVRYAATAGTLLGFLQLIPEVGFFLGLFPILLLIPVNGPLTALIVFIVYWLAVRIADGLIGTRVSRGVLDVHPAVLIPAIVVLSQFGIAWLVAAAPLVAIVRDVVRYAMGRLSDPPAPAGVIARARRRAPAVAAAIPSVYRTAAARPARGAVPAVPTGAGPVPIAVAIRPAGSPIASSVIDPAWRARP